MKEGREGGREGRGGEGREEGGNTFWPITGNVCQHLFQRTIGQQDRRNLGMLITTKSRAVLIFLTNNLWTTVREEKGVLFYLIYYIITFSLFATRAINLINQPSNHISLNSFSIDVFQFLER